jgi:hypothetical protein
VPIEEEEEDIFGNCVNNTNLKLLLWNQQTLEFIGIHKNGLVRNKESDM